MLGAVLCQPGWQAGGLLSVSCACGLVGCAHRDIRGVIHACRVFYKHRLRLLAAACAQLRRRRVLLLLLLLQVRRWVLLLRRWLRAAR